MTSHLRFPVTLNALRIGLALAGFAGALIGVALDDRQIAWGAIALLIGSLICRILLRKREESRSRPAEECDGNHR
ncbi:MAG TPA: hypothetical protein VHH32_12065 [Gemmatimonadales bacterium]|nr:hypothetical protein [Gemmatimonadales bacterium]